MKKSLLILPILLFTVFFGFNVSHSNAQVTTTTRPTQTIVFVQDLKIGSRGSGVKVLQRFLRDQGYYFGKIDGVYGKKTARIVKEFQDDNDLPVTGIVDKTTVIAMNAALNDEGDVDIITLPPPIGIDPCETNINSSACQSKNNLPVISGVSGPQSLNTNQQGTWVVKASSSSKSDLSYSVDWGDQPVIINSIPRVQPSQQSAVFSHAYSQEGTYAVTFTVSNQYAVNCYLAPCPPQGGTTQASMTVNVTKDTTGNLSIITPSVLPNATVGTPYSVYFNSSDSSPAQHYWHLFNQSASPTSVFKDISWGSDCYTSVCGPFTATPIRAGTFTFTVQVVLGNQKVSKEFTLTINQKTTQDPIISGVSGPQQLNLNQTGTWAVSAFSKNGGDLFYSAIWGDENIPGSVTQGGLQQSASFTHAYRQPGNYKVIFTVSTPNTINCITSPCPSNAGSAQTSITVNVGGDVSNSIAIISPKNNSSSNVGPSVVTWTKFPAMSTSGEYYIELKAVNVSAFPSGGVISSGNISTASAGCSNSSVCSFSLQSIYPQGINLSGTYSVVVTAREPNNVVISNSASSTFTINEATSYSLTVLSPNGGESFVSGNYLPILFNIASVPTYPNLYIELRPADNNYSQPTKIAVISSSNRDYNWLIPANVISGKYIIEIYSADQNGNVIDVSKDISNSSFQITALPTIPASIKVISPNGGESLKVGDTKLIQWSTINYPYNTPITLYLLSRIGGGTTGNPYAYSVVQTISTSFTGGTSASWSVPLVPDGSNYYIQVGCSSEWNLPYNCNGDLSDSSFSITSTPTPVSGVCATTHYGCLSGTVNSASDDSAHYEWWCQGANGGANTMCSEQKIIIMPVNNKVLCSPMSSNYAVRGCTNYIEHLPVYKADSNLCLSYCKSANATACEYERSTGNCYAEEGSNCSVESGYNGWDASVNSCSVVSTLNSSMLTAGVLNSIQQETQTVVSAGEIFKFSKFLELGSYGEEVKQLQRRLSKLGYYAGKLDSIFGTGLKEALTKYQTDNKLKADGILGYEARTSLNR